MVKKEKLSARISEGVILLSVFFFFLPGDYNRGNINELFEDGSVFVCVYVCVDYRTTVQAAGSLV